MQKGQPAWCFKVHPWTQTAVRKRQSVSCHCRVQPSNLETQICQARAHCGKSDQQSPATNPLDELEDNCRSFPNSVWQWKWELDFSEGSQIYLLQLLQYLPITRLLKPPNTTDLQTLCRSSDECLLRSVSMYLSPACFANTLHKVA